METIGTKATFYSCPVCSELQKPVIKYGIINGIKVFLNCKTCNTISEINILKEVE